MIKKLLFTVFLVLVQTVVFAVPKTYIGPNNGVWNTAANWSPSGVPSSSDDVIIPTVKTVTVNVNAEAKSIVVVGNLTLATTYTLIVYGDFTVTAATTGPNVPEGNFKIVENGNSTTTLIVLGNYINNGKTDFDKGDVIIVGNLITPETSTLQNLGNVIVGGDIIGDFNLQGSIQTNQQIYAVNPNATVIITPDNIDKDVVPGTPVTTTTESSTLVGLVNLYIYGGNCTFTVNNIANVSACSGSNAVFMVTTSVTPSSYQWQVNKNDGTGWVNLTNDAPYSGVLTASITIAGVAISMNNYKYRAKITSGSPSCTKNGNYGVLAVNAAPTTPTVGSVTQPTCSVATGTFQITGYDAARIYTFTPTVVSISVTGLVTANAGTYTFTVNNASGCVSPASANVGINAFVAEINTWNANAWSNGIPPKINGTQKLVFNSIFISSDDLSGCSCEVNDDVLIQSGHNLTLTNELKVVSGDMVFESGSSLVQENDNVVNSNTGIIKYQRIARSLNTDYTYWSSPVSNQTLYDLIPTALAGTSYSYEQTATSENWLNAAGSTPMAPGKGYIIRGREGTQTPPKLNDVEFAGIPNNGPYPISPIYSDKSYLLGNPYPSAINADLFLAANAGVLNGTLYFWTHNTAIQAANALDLTLGSGAYAYTSNDYATYNITGGVGIDLGTATGPAPSGSTISGANNSTPNGYISAGQGFFASTKTSLSGSSIVFNNNMRVAGGATLSDGSIVNGQFFKTKNPNKSSKLIEKNRIWLNLTNTQGAFKQTLIGYITEATNEYDDRFDGESYDGNEFVDFYSVNQEKNLVIQGRALPFDENDEVPLGFRTTINGAFTINIDQVDGFLTNQAVLIEDKLTNTVFDLKSGNYTFNTTAGTFDNRFVLRFKDNSVSKTLAADSFDSLEKTVLVSTKNKQIRIDSAIERIDKVTVFDLLGKQIYQKANVNSNELSIANLVSNRQMLMVKTTLQNGKTVTKKVIY